MESLKCIEESGDDLSTFETALSSLPCSMLLGPGGQPNPPTTDLFDDKGIIKWEYFSKTKLWGEANPPPVRESEGFLRGAHYLYNFSDVLNQYWLKMSASEFVERYGQGFCGFTKEPSFLPSLFEELQLSLREGSLSASCCTMKIARMSTSWLEKLLYVLCNYFRSIEPELASLSKSKSKSRTIASATQVQSAAAAANEASDSAETNRAISFLTLKMKDILAMPELAAKIGEDRVYLLTTMVGPLHSINLRNLLWHGFVSPHEWPSYLTCMMFTLLLSLAVEFSEHLNTELYQTMLSQVQTNLSFFNPYLLQTSPLLATPNPEFPLDPTLSPASNRDAYTQALNQSLNDHSKRVWDLVHTQRHAIVQLIHRSAFCLNGSKREWVYGLQMALEGKYFDAFCVFFPLLEASLRRVYVEANNIQSFRLTAEPDTLCLSLDLILEDWLDREAMIQDRRTKRRARYAPKTESKETAEDGDEEDDEDEPIAETDGQIENRIFKSLGPTCGVVFDLLIWADTLGLKRHYRPRDQLAHGSAIPSQVSHVNCLHLLLCLINLFQRFENAANFANGPAEEEGKDINMDTLSSSLESLRIDSNLFKSEEIDILKMSKIFIKYYKPCFHKKRAVIDLYQSLVDYLSGWKQRCDELMTPMVVHLLKDAIAKEMKKDDVQWAERMKVRYVELSHIKSRLEAAVDKVYLKCASSSELNNDRLNMFALKTPITLKHLVQLIHVDDLVTAISTMAKDIYTRAAKLRDEVEARTAWLSDRRNFAGLVASLPVFGLGIEILLLFVKEMLCHPGLAEAAQYQRLKASTTDLPTFIWTMVQRMNALVAIGKYRYAEEVLECLLLSVPKLPTLIGKGEGFRCWIDIEGYLWRLDLFVNDQPLLPYDVFKHPRNAHIVQMQRAYYHSGVAFDSRTMSPFPAPQYELFLLQHQLGHQITTTETSMNTFWVDEVLS